MAAALKSVTTAALPTPRTDPGRIDSGAFSHSRGRRSSGSAPPLPRLIPAVAGAEVMGPLHCGGDAGGQRRPGALGRGSVRLRVGGSLRQCVRGLSFDLGAGS